MERIAFVFGSSFVYWSSVVITLAAAGAICLFLALYLKKSENTLAASAVVPLSAILSLIAARMLHWYCFAESYESFLAAMTHFRSGGFALLGVFAGCVAAAAITRGMKLHRNLPQMLDCMCLSGCAGIAVGRLASFFNASDRGQIVEFLRSMPWVYPVVNSVSGITEYRLATFLLQAMVAGALFLGLTVYLFLGKAEKRKDGDITLLFLLCYSAAEVILDSTRYDSMYFRSNGFVSIIQVISTVALVLTIALFSLRLVKARGFRGWYIALWVGILALMGCAGYMEYYVQRHGNEAVFAYSIMGSCLCGIVLLALALFLLAGKPSQRTKPRYLKQ